ncbi:hypothetical protein RRG08_023795 [Elysia crispata]|uniref:Uncharacterized protein n=1 Tax=Elysia crispata TaxID=231223 RepID=A0AAE1DP03_9GAST|nr:hypothetical protein RRG08_023795 [Elysia crispata]
MKDFSEIKKATRSCGWSDSNQTVHKLFPYSHCVFVCALKAFGLLQEPICRRVNPSFHTPDQLRILLLKRQAYRTTLKIPKCFNSRCVHMGEVNHLSRAVRLKEGPPVLITALIASFRD